MPEEAGGPKGHGQGQAHGHYKGILFFRLVIVSEVRITVQGEIIVGQVLLGITRGGAETQTE